MRPFFSDSQHCNQHAKPLYLTLIRSISVSIHPRQSLLELLRNHPEGHLDPSGADAWYESTHSLLEFLLLMNHHFPLSYRLYVVDQSTRKNRTILYAQDGVDTPKGVVIDDKGFERIDSKGILRDWCLGRWG
jgi:hypothetical protein